MPSPSADTQKKFCAYSNLLNMLNFYVFDSDEESVAHIPKARRGVLGPLNEKLAQSIRQQLSNNLKD